MVASQSTMNMNIRSEGDNDQKMVVNEAVHIPTIDLSMKNRSEVSKLIVKACEEFGFFKVVNHGVPSDVIAQMEEESFKFFAKPLAEKQLAGPAKPFGYGLKYIGCNGDMGEVEYILLHSNPLTVDHHSNTISSDPKAFSGAVKGYMEAVKRLGSEILELMCEGLMLSDTKRFSRLINDADADSLFRLNHYPITHSDAADADSDGAVIGIGEHSDPQILTLLRSNGVAGLQIHRHHWLTVPPDPTSFFLNVGDVLQAMTNGRFVSVRHRAITNSESSRMSIAYFAGPPLSAMITASKELLAEDKPCLYRPFTWADYKKTTYSLRLGQSRLHLFKASNDHNLNTNVK